MPQNPAKDERELTIGQLNRRRVGVNTRKDTPISYIRMGDQRDWFSVRSRRNCVNLHCALQVSSFCGGFFAARKEAIRGKH